MSEPLWQTQIERFTYKHDFGCWVLNLGIQKDDFCTVVKNKKGKTWEFDKIWTVCNCEFNAKSFLGFYNLLFDLETIAVS